MSFHHAASALLFWGLLFSGCTNPGVAPDPGDSESAAPPPRVNVAIKSHRLPETYRFDTQVADAHIVAAEAAHDMRYIRHFDFSSDSQQWTPSAETCQSTVAEGVLTVDATETTTIDSPELVSLAPKDVAALFIEARVTGAAQFSVAWREADSEFRPTETALVKTHPSEDWHLYRFDTASHTTWKRKKDSLAQLRFILPENGHMEIRSIGLASEANDFSGKSYGQLDYTLRQREHVHAMFARVPCTLEYEVQVMEDAELQTGFLLAERHPTMFRIVLDDGNSETVLAEMDLDQENVVRPVNVDMSAWTGKKVKIRFEAESEFDDMVALWAYPRLARTFPVDVAERPINVIWYVIDALRPASMSAYGYKRETTPTIEAVAREGVRFDWCFSPASWTVDSVSSFFTGIGPNAHDMRHNGRPLTHSLRVLPEIFRGMGYTTALFSQNPYVDKPHGFMRGFDVLERYRVRGSGVRRSGTVEDYKLNTSIADFLEANKENPQFIYVHSLEPHLPYEPPPGFRIFPEAGDIPSGVDPYDCCVFWADTNLGHTIEQLKKKGLWDNTLLIISADHGESLPSVDEGLQGHGEAPYLSRVWIPLIMRLPGFLPEGMTVSENVQALDIPRTLFELLDFEMDPQFGGDSLLGLLDGSNADQFANRSVFASGNHAKWESVAKDNWFYLDNDGAGELIDRHVSPSQGANVISEHLDVAKELHEETIEHRAAEKALSEVYNAGREGVIELDEETREELRAIGYLE